MTSAYTTFNLGVREPVVDRRLGLANSFDSIFQPDTGSVVDAFIGEIYEGPGSLKQDILASEVDIAREPFDDDLEILSPVESTLRLSKKITASLEGRESFVERKMTQEEWEASPYFRKGLFFDDATTETVARIRAENFDETNARRMIIERATGGQMALGFGAALPAGFFEPKNAFIGLATLGVGSAIRRTGHLAGLVGDTMRKRSLAETSLTTGQAFRRGLTEGFVATGLVEASAGESAIALQDDYTATDSLLNLGLGSLLGGILDGGTTALGGYLRSHSDTNLMNGMQVAVDQMAEGKVVEVEPFLEVAQAAEPPNFSSVHPAQRRAIAEVNTKKLPKKEQYESRIPMETGLMSGAVGRGKTHTEAVRDLMDQYAVDTDVVGVDVRAQVAKKKRELVDVVKELKDIESTRSQLESDLGYDADAIAAQEKKIADYKKTRSKQRKGMSPGKGGKNIKEFNAKTANTLFELEQELTAIKAAEGDAKAEAARIISDRKVQLKSDIKRLKREYNEAAGFNTKLEKYAKSLADDTKPERLTAVDADADARFAEEFTTLKTDRELSDVEVELRDLEEVASNMDKSGSFTEGDMKEIAAINEEFNKVQAFKDAVDTALDCSIRG